MTAIIVNNATPFGSLSNSAIERLVTAIADIHRVRQAETAAQSGAPDPTAAALESGSNFGVLPSSTVGEQGAAYAYALEVLDDALQEFLTTHQGHLTALDNGRA